MSKTNTLITMRRLTILTYELYSLSPFKEVVECPVSLLNTLVCRELPGILLLVISSRSIVCVAISTNLILLSSRKYNNKDEIHN